MTVETFQQFPVVSGESQADVDLAEDQARQAGPSRAMDRASVDAVQAEHMQRQHMVAELAEQRAEGAHERTDAALAAAEAERMPPPMTLPLAAPAAFEHHPRRGWVVRHAGWLAVGLAALGVGVGGGVLLVRRRRH